MNNKKIDKVFRNSSSLKELYGFADEESVYRYQKKYAEFFKEGPVIDLGCGRGIFLKILREHGIEGIGVDNSDLAYEHARGRGFRIYRYDIFDFLKRNIGEGKTYKGIFCSHFIEHLPYKKAKEFLSLCFEVLQKDGILIIVTPNPKDLRVMTDIFWLDPSHVRPYPLDLLKGLIVENGFRVKEFGVDKDTQLNHFENKFFDKISKLFFSKTPLGLYLNTGHDIYVIGVKK